MTLPCEFAVVLYGHEQNVLRSFTHLWTRSEQGMKHFASMLVKYSGLNPKYICVNTEYGEHFERYYGGGVPANWTDEGIEYRHYKGENEK